MPATPFLAPLLRALGAEFVNRLDHERSVADAASLAGRLARGGSLGFFPRAPLHRMPGLLPFRLGAFSVAVEGDARVVPVTIAGSRSVMRDGQWIPAPRPGLGPHRRADRPATGCSAGGAGPRAGGRTG